VSSWDGASTHQSIEKLSLKQAVEASRDASLGERYFGRLKGHPLSLSPTDVERDDHATGLVRLLSLVLRVLMLLECVVRRHLAQQGASLAGLSAGNPQRATTRPTTERVLEAFQGIFLAILVEPYQTRRHLTALSALQQRILALVEFSPTLYSNLCEDSSEPP
jgi:transposase